MATRGQTILIPWAHYTYTMAWDSYAHACNIWVCVLGTRGSLSRDNNMHADHSQHFNMHRPTNNSHSMLNRREQETIFITYLFQLTVDVLNNQIQRYKVLSTWGNNGKGQPFLMYIITCIMNSNACYTSIN